MGVLGHVASKATDARIGVVPLALIVIAAFGCGDAFLPPEIREARDAMTAIGALQTPDGLGPGVSFDVAAVLGGHGVAVVFDGARTPEEKTGGIYWVDGTKAYALNAEAQRYSPGLPTSAPEATSEVVLKALKDADNGTSQEHADLDSNT